MKKKNSPHLENITDLLWLSQFTGMQSVVAEKVEDKKQEKPKQENQIEDDEVEEDHNGSEPEVKEPEEDLEVHTDNKDDKSSSHTKQKKAKAIQSPKKLALSNYREWEKAFKFINLKQPSKNRYELDEEKTVESIASSNVFDLVFKQVQEKRFFLTMVIDRGETMELWDELIKNFEQMLLTMGVFARVSIYYWDTKDKKPKLYADKELKREVSEKLVIMEGKRNLVWVMSDCLAPSWRSSEAFKSIERWSEKSFTSILQMFPKEMWMGTMLFKGKQVRLTSTSFNSSNKKLKVQSYKREKNALKIPVISFDPYALQAWAKVVVNAKNNSISGIELENVDFPPVESVSKKEITSEMRMQRFYSQASPTAQKLAFYMSVLPVDFKVTRILQEERLPKSNQAHVAEVFLGGLIERRKKEKSVYYDFYPKIREELNANISADDSFEIMQDMSSFVSSHLGVGFDFKALLADPNGVFEGDIEISSESLAYARLASRVLKRKGGKLYDIAQAIDKKVIDIETEVFPKGYEEQIIKKLSHTFIDELVNYEIDDESLTSDGGIATISQLGEPENIKLLKINQIENNQYSLDVSFDIDSYITVDNPSYKVFEGRESEYTIHVDCSISVEFNEKKELLSLTIDETSKVEVYEQKYSGSPFCNIRVIGVGGGGGHTINHMFKEGIEGIDLIIANTDIQALDNSPIRHKIQLGSNVTKGLGAGMKVEVGKASAEESYESIKEMLDGADLVFILTGLGGGTGTGASPVIAHIAKEIGALTVSIASTPFKFEGKKRQKLAKKGLQLLEKESDSIIFVPNERLLSIVEKNLGMRDSFKLVDNVLSQAVTGISNVILSHGANDINLDFADVKTVMSHRGLALMGIGESQGNSAAYDAAKTAIESPLLDNLSIDGAMGILVHFHIHPHYPLAEISQALDIVEESADEDANIIFGTTAFEDYPLDKVQVTIIATGFDDYNGWYKDILNEDRMEYNDITFYCEECFTEYHISCDDLDWKKDEDYFDIYEFDSNHTQIVTHEAIYAEDCNNCSNSMNITFTSNEEYPLGIETFRDIEVDGVKDLEGNCSLEYTSIDREPDDIPHSNFLYEKEARRIEDERYDELLSEYENRNLKKYLHSNDKKELANLIEYPLQRHGFIPNIRNKEEFIQRYSQIFDEKLRDMLLQASDDDWSEVGSKGTMFKNGDIWISDGKIIAINYLSEEEQSLQKELKNKDKEFIHTSLKDYAENKLVWLNKNYRIRIDEIEDSLYRCAIWKKGRKSDRKPNLILQNGRVTFDGSGGNHYYTFVKSKYKYVININILGIDDSLGQLLVYKNDELIEEETFLKNDDATKGGLDIKYKISTTLEDIKIKINEPWSDSSNMNTHVDIINSLNDSSDINTDVDIINPWKNQQKEKENLDKLRGKKKKK